jgi:hypothetical protein
MAAQLRWPIGSIAFASAFLVSILDVVGATGAARAADCLTAPGSSGPANSHWYYRTDRTAQHKCWYLRPADGSAPQQDAVKTTQSASAADPYSLAKFKDFLAGRGDTNLSDTDVAELYAEFQVWRQRPENQANERQ